MNRAKRSPIPECFLRRLPKESGHIANLCVLALQGRPLDLEALQDKVPLSFEPPLQHSCSIHAFRSKERLSLLRRKQPTHKTRSEEHTSELQSRLHLVCRLL